MEMIMRLFAELVCQKLIKKFVKSGGGYGPSPDLHGELEKGVEEIFKKMEDECTRQIKLISPTAESYQANRAIAIEFVEKIYHECGRRFVQISDYGGGYGNALWPLAVQAKCYEDSVFFAEIEKIIKDVKNECMARTGGENEAKIIPGIAREFIQKINALKEEYMGIKSEFYLSVSFDTLRDVLSHIIPEGVIVDKKLELGPVNANVWATRTGPFTTYVKDQTIYLAAPFHVNLKFPNFFVHGIAGEQILKFTLTVKCAVITTENLGITVNLDIFKINWKAKPALRGGITVTGHVEPLFRNWLNPKLQEVAVLINENLSFQAGVNSIQQKIQTPIKLQSLLIKSGSEGTIYYMHPNLEITMMPIQITDAGFMLRAVVDVETTIDLNPLAHNKIIKDANPSLSPQHASIDQMFRYAAEDNLEGIKSLYQSGIPINIKHPYHSGTLLHQAIYTERQPQPAGVWGWPHTSIKVLKWLLAELEKNGELAEILNTRINCDKVTRSDWVEIYSPIVMGLDNDGFINKTPLEMMHYWHQKAQPDIAQVRGGTAAPNYGSIIAWLNIAVKELDEGLTLLTEYTSRLQSEETSNCYGSTKQNTGRKLMELQDIPIDVDDEKSLTSTQQNLVADNDMENTQTSGSAGQPEPWITGLYRQSASWFSSWWNSVPKMTGQSTSISEEEITAKKEVTEKALLKAKKDIVALLEFLELFPNKKLEKACLFYKDMIQTWMENPNQISADDLKDLKLDINKLGKAIYNSDNIFSAVKENELSQRAGIYTTGFLKVPTNITETPLLTAGINPLYLGP